MVLFRRELKLDYALMPSQIANAMMQATITNHTSGVTCLELPLRGESLAA
jgi:hypothetical protein